MTAKHDPIPIIPTRAYSTLASIGQTLLETARLGIVRGPVGIGKTYALRQVADDLTQGDDEAFLFEAPSDKSASVQRFYQKLLFDLGFGGHGGADPYEFFKGQMLRSYPFRTFKPRPRILLIVDECQRLAPNVLETLRSAYDKGQIARDHMGDAPAFGVLLVGNHHFLSRGGRAVSATFDALQSRAPINVDLSRPDAAEYRAVSRSLFPDSEELSAAIALHGAKRGNLREMAETVAMARNLANGSPLTSAHLAKAILFSGEAV